MNARPLLVVGLAALALPAVLRPGAYALPKYAKQEGVSCGYCHIKAAGGGERNYRGAFFAANKSTFAGFEDAAEAKKAGVDVAAFATEKPSSRTPPKPAAPVVPRVGLAPAIIDTAAWKYASSEGGTATADETALKVTVPAKPADYQQLFHDLEVPPPDAARLVVRFWAKTDAAPFKLSVSAQRAAVGEDDWASLGLYQTVEVGGEWREYTAPWTVTAPHRRANKVSFMLNGNAGKPTTIWLRDVSITPADPAAWAAAQPPSDPKALPPFARWRDPVSGVWFVKLPAGAYTQGTTPAQKAELVKLGLWGAADADQTPARRVEISRPFLLSETEVTQAQWRALMKDAKAKNKDGKETSLAEPSAFKGRDEHPVDSVSFEEAETFCRTLSAKAGAGVVYRLPTEAEWEYAARAGSEGALPLGPDKSPIAPARIKEFCWMNGTAKNATGAVAGRRPNAWGLYDTLGNVWEWCRDAYASDAYAKLPARDPLYRSTTATERVLRGGSWFLDARGQRPALRGGNLPTFKSPYVGIRLVREL